MSSDTNLPGARRSWARHMARIGSDHGSFERLGDHHMALFVQEGDLLVLSFDRADHLWDKGTDGLPSSFQLVEQAEWSMLSLMAVRPRGFDDDVVDAFITGLKDSGFFDTFAHVLLMGQGRDGCNAAARALRHIPRAHLCLTRPEARSGPQVLLRQYGAPAPITLSDPGMGRAFSRAETFVPVSRALVRGVPLNEVAARSMVPERSKGNDVDMIEMIRRMRNLTGAPDTVPT